MKEHSICFTENGSPSAGLTTCALRSLQVLALRRAKVISYRVTHPSRGHDNHANRPLSASVSRFSQFCLILDGLEASENISYSERATRTVPLKVEIVHPGQIAEQGILHAQAFQER